VARGSGQRAIRAHRAHARPKSSNASRERDDARCPTWRSGLVGGRALRTERNDAPASRPACSGGRSAPVEVRPRPRGGDRRDAPPRREGVRWRPFQLRARTRRPVAIARSVKIGSHASVSTRRRSIGVVGCSSLVDEGGASAACLQRAVEPHEAPSRAGRSFGRRATASSRKRRPRRTVAPGARRARGRQAGRAPLGGSPTATRRLRAAGRQAERARIGRCGSSLLGPGRRRPRPARGALPDSATSATNREGHAAPTGRGVGRGQADVISKASIPGVVIRFHLARPDLPTSGVQLHGEPRRAHKKEKTELRPEVFDDYDAFSSRHPGTYYDRVKRRRARQLHRARHRVGPGGSSDGGRRDLKDGTDKKAAIGAGRRRRSPHRAALRASRAHRRDLTGAGAVALASYFIKTQKEITARCRSPHAHRRDAHAASRRRPRAVTARGRPTTQRAQPSMGDGLSSALEDVDAA